MTTQESQTTNVPAPDARRWLALVVLCVGMLMIVLDVTVVNVALPSIQSDLGFSQSSLAWVVNAYLISFGGLLLLAGRLGDLVGRRRIFMIGLAVFTIASLLCGLAQSQAMLIGARFAQGAGGVLTDAINWHWIFFINLPIAVGTALLAARLIDRDSGIGLGRGADALGAGLVTGALMLAVYTIVKASEYGWGSLHTVGLGALSLGLLAAFVVRQARGSNPLMPLRIFRSRNVAGANLVQVVVVAGMFGMFFMGTLYMERVLGYDPLEIGLAFLPATVLMGIFSAVLSAPLNARFGARGTLVPALALVLGALVLFAVAPVDGSYVSDVLPAAVLIGVGAGLAFPSLMTLAMSGATQEDAGLASGLINTTAQVGGALGLAVLATLASSRSEDVLAAGESAPQALTSGYHLAFAVGAALVIAGIAVALTVLAPERVAAEQAAQRSAPKPAYAEG